MLIGLEEGVLATSDWSRVMAVSVFGDEWRMALTFLPLFFGLSLLALEGLAFIFAGSSGVEGCS